MSSRAPAREAAQRAADGDGRRGELQELVEISVQLARDGIRVHYKGTVLSYFWVLARPLLWFSVLYVLFTSVLPFGHGIPHYAEYLLLSLTLWTCFTEVTSGCLVCFVAQAALLRKLSFPRAALPIAAGLIATFNLVMNLVVVLGIVLASGIPPRWSWLELPGLVLLLALLSAGGGFVLSTLYVRYRDIDQIWSILRQMLFYGSAVLFPITRVNGDVRQIVGFNPIATLLTQARHAVIEPSAPSAAAALGGAAGLFVPFAVLALVVACGVWILARDAPRLAERV